MQPKAKQNQEKLEFWREHLGRLAASGLSQAEYCRTHELKWFQRHYWRKKLERDKELVGGQLRLVPVQAIDQGHGGGVQHPSLSQIRLSFDGFTIEVNDGFKSETLEKMIKVLVRCRC